MGLLAERVAGDDAPRAASLAPRRSPAASRRSATIDEGVLVAVGETLALGGEAVVPEGLDEIAAVQPDRPLGAALGRRRGSASKATMSSAMSRPGGRRSTPSDVEHRSRGRRPRPMRPWRTSQRAWRSEPADVLSASGPQVGGDRLARPRAAAEDEQGEEGRGVAAPEGHPRPGGGSDVDPARAGSPAGGLVGAAPRRAMRIPSVHALDARPVPPWAGRRARAGGPPDPPPRAAPQAGWPRPRATTGQGPMMSGAVTAGRPGGVTRQVSASRHPRAAPAAATTGSRYTADTVPIAVIAFDFDPLLHLVDGLVVRWETVALAAVIVAALIVAGAHGAPRVAAARRPPLHRRRGRPGRGDRRPDRLRPAPPRLLRDAGPAPSSTRRAAASSSGSPWSAGSLSGLYRRDAPRGPGRTLVASSWSCRCSSRSGRASSRCSSAAPDRASRPTLAWATAFLGPGPWASLAPALPSHPSQAYEGFATPGARARARGRPRARASGTARRRPDPASAPSRSGRSVRAAVTLTWRDPAVVWAAQRRHADRARGRDRVRGRVVVAVVARGTGATAERRRRARRPVCRSWPDAWRTRPGESRVPDGPRGRTPAGWMA